MIGEPYTIGGGISQLLIGTVSHANGAHLITNVAGVIIATAMVAWQSRLREGLIAFAIGGPVSVFMASAIAGNPVLGASGGVLAIAALVITRASEKHPAIAYTSLAALVARELIASSGGTAVGHLTGIAVGTIIGVALMLHRRQ